MDGDDTKYVDVDIEEEDCDERGGDEEEEDDDDDDCNDNRDDDVMRLTDYGKEKSVKVEGMSKAQIGAQIEGLVKFGENMPKCVT